MPFVIYSVQRLALFVAALLLLWSLHLGGWLLVVIAAFLAWAVSYLALAGPRDRAALWVSARVEGRGTGPRFSAAVEADAMDEDAEASALAPAGSEGQAQPEQDAVAEREHAGAGEDGTQQDAARPRDDGGREQADGEGEQQHEQ